METSDFPEQFLFGTATASYQVEGAVAEDGRGESIWDRFSHTQGKIRSGHTGDVACDHYHRFKEDIALMTQMGVNAYRFSIAWPRIIPDGEGRVNQKGLDWYARLADALRGAGIEPCATMYHWDLPQALEEKYGGWRSRKTVEAFGRYAEVIVRHLGDRIRHWMTLNEMPCIVYLGHKEGRHAPGAHEPENVLNQIKHHCLLAHGLGVRAVRQFGRGGKVGVVHNPSIFVPVYEEPDHIEASRKAFSDRNDFLHAMAWGRYPERWLDSAGKDAPAIQQGDMELIGAKTDFIGLNVYGAHFVSSADTSEGYRVLPTPEGYPRAYAQWITVVPQALYWAVRWACTHFNWTKAYITENGCAMDDRLVDGEVHDLDRVQFYRLYLQAAARAVCEGLPLAGYFAWSLMDNFEWAEGYHHRFGLYYVDFETQRRIPKASARYYAVCIRSRRVL